MSVTTGGVTITVLTGRTASALQRYRDQLEEGQEPALFTATRHCSHDVETQIAEWKAVRVEHGTQGAKRRVDDSYEKVDPETGIHANGQRGTHVRYYDGKQWRKRPVREGEMPTYLHVPADHLVADVKQSEAVHTIHAAGADLINPDNPEDCAKFFHAVKSMREETYPGLQESMWLERNGESGLVHVHVASNATIYEDFELDGVQYRAGNKMAKELTKLDSVRARFEQYLDAHPEYELKQGLARVGTKEYAAAQQRDGQAVYWEAKRTGKETQQDQIRRKVYEALLDETVHDHASFVQAMDDLGVEVDEVGLRRGKPGKNHDYLYRLKSGKQKVKGKTLGIDYTHNAIGAQLELKAVSAEIELPTGKQKVGPAKPLPFEAKPWSEQTQRDYKKLIADIQTMVDNEHQRQVAELLEQGPVAIGHSVIRELEGRRSAWSTDDLDRAIDRRLSPMAKTEHDDLDQMKAQARQAAQTRLVSILDRDVDSTTIRHWTTQEIVDQERVISDSLKARAQHEGADGTVTVDRGDFTLAEGQARAGRMLTGSHRLVVVEGAAGSGKTTALDAANEELKRQGRRMVVVSPTKKGAIEAGEAIDAEGNSVHSMLYRAGAYMDPDDGNRWVLPEEWKDQPPQWLMDEDTVLLVDEVGMLDKSTAAVLHQYVDDVGVGTFAIMGDSKQLAAVGRGGYLARAAELADQHVVLEELQRFRTSSGELDVEYAADTLKLRLREDPGEFVDLLARRNQLSIGDEAQVIDGVAATLVDELEAGHDSMAISATNATNQTINHAIFDRLIERGIVDDTTVVQGRDGDRIAVGAKVATRKNSVDFDVANRETWEVVGVKDNGDISVRDDKGRRRDLTAAYVREEVQLAWALTAHGAQGMTVDRAHVVISDRMDAAGLYVSLTRGRHANTVHAVADSDLGARKQFIATTRRDHADAGLDRARERAERQAAEQEPMVTQQPVKPEYQRRTFVTKADPLQRYRKEYGRELQAASAVLADEYRRQYPSESESSIDTLVSSKLSAMARSGSLDQKLAEVRGDLVRADQQKSIAEADSELQRLKQVYGPEMAEVTDNLVWSHTKGAEQSSEDQAKVEALVLKQLRTEALSGELEPTLEEQRQAHAAARDHSRAKRPAEEVTRQKPRTAAEQRVLDRQAKQAVHNRKTRQAQQEQSQNQGMGL